MIHSTYREPIRSFPLMRDQGVVWTSPQPLEMTQSHDELYHPHWENFQTLTQPTQPMYFPC